jgi:hypothetical protein
MTDVDKQPLSLEEIERLIEVAEAAVEVEAKDPERLYQTQEETSALDEYWQVARPVTVLRLCNQVKQLQQENEQLREEKSKSRGLLQNVLTWALANRGTKDEFVRCYTYGKSYPEIIVAIKNFLGEAYRKDFKVKPVRD